MEFIKNDIYKPIYTSKLANINIKRKRTSLKRYISNNKILISIISVFVCALIIDCTLIYNFFRILERIQ